MVGCERKRKLLTNKRYGDRELPSVRGKGTDGSPHQQFNIYKLTNKNNQIYEEKIFTPDAFGLFGWICKCAA